VLANPPLQEAVIVSLERERHEKRTAMPAVVIKATINDRDTLPTTLTELVPVVSGAPGFVGGYWILLGRDQGIASLVFDTEESASLQALATQVAGTEAATTDRLEAGEVRAQAEDRVFKLATARGRLTSAMCPALL
jgi:hypothetical protein